MLKSPRRLVAFGALCLVLAVVGAGFVVGQWLNTSDGCDPCPGFHKTLGNVVMILVPVAVVTALGAFVAAAVRRSRHD